MDLPFDMRHLDALMDDAGVDLLLATDKDTVQYLTGGYRFFFFSREEPRMHVHVICADGESKFWLDPAIELARIAGCNGDVCGSRWFTGLCRAPRQPKPRACPH